MDEEVALGIGASRRAGSRVHSQYFNTLKRIYSAVRNPLARMKCMFKEHQIQTSANTASLQPTVVKRKKGNSSSDT